MSTNKKSRHLEMKKSMYAAACLLLMTTAVFTSCAKDEEEELDFTPEQIAYFEKNRDYIREKKTEKDEEGNLKYTPIGMAYGDTVLYRVISRKGEESKTPTSQTKIFMTLKGDLIDGHNFQKEDTMTFRPAQLITGVAVSLLESTVGETCEAIVPASLGYGYRNNGAIPAGSTLVFTYTVNAYR